ncbi:MAG: adenylate/guanylate cyclase domain-containing protein [Acidimicrobiia bacterium]
MIEHPETRFARTRDGESIAFQVCGHGALDLVYVPNWASPIDLIWDHPLVARFLTRLASFSRLILFDKRGSGSSDNVSVDALATLEDWTDDIATVMDAVGSERAALVGATVGCPISMLFAATRPERTSALVLINASARRLADSDYPGVDPERADDLTADFRSAWGTDAVVELVVPSMVGDEAFRRWFTRFCRVGNPPNMAAAVFRAHLASDVRASLPLIQAPTLVMLRAGAERFTTAAQSRFLADNIAGARHVEVPGNDSLPYGSDAAALLDEIEEFLTGDRPRFTTDRVLATVLFTDIVGSTEHAAAVGDRRWREQLDQHDARVRSQLDAFGGREISTAGDSFFAVFDGPARAVRCAHAIIDDINELGIEMRAGVHTGECEVRGHDYAGIAVHVGARIRALAGPGEVLTSSTVKDLVAGSGITFHDCGEHQLKGVPDPWHLYRATGSPRS